MAKENPEKYTLKRAGVSEQIFTILKEKIASGEWKPGEKITSENELAAQFGVSRMSARNALQRLCAMGLLETRTGEGTFVKAFRLADYFQNAVELIDWKQSMNDIGEFRYFFENDYLTLACQRRTEQDIEDLRKIQQKMVDLSTGDNFDAFFDTDMEFHHRICQMTGNDVFLMVESLLRKYLIAQLKDNTKHYTTVKNASMDRTRDDYVLKILAKEHEEFIEALVKRDSTLVTNRLEKYLSQYRVLRESEGSTQDTKL